jgi:hypothetical protein
MGNNDSKTSTRSIVEIPFLVQPWRILLLLRALKTTYLLPSNLIDAIFYFYAASLHTNPKQCAIIPNNFALAGQFASIDPSRWMGQLYGATRQVKLSDIVIPGTHDSATWKGSFFLLLDRFFPPLFRLIY